jgi:hypothetical protein
MQSGRRDSNPEAREGAGFRDLFGRFPVNPCESSSALLGLIRGAISERGFPCESGSVRDSLTTFLTTPHAQAPGAV